MTTAGPRATRFTYDAARLGALLWGLALVLVIETVVLHLWLVARHPVVAWALLASNVLTIGWLVRDDRALGRIPIEVADGELRFRFGTRWRADIPLAMVASATRVDWRAAEALADPSRPRDRTYLRAATTGTPNVLVTLREPVPVHGPMRIVRPVRTLGLCLDEPDAFIAALREAATPAA